MLRNILCWKGFGPVTGPPSFPGANFQQMVIARLSLGLSFLGLRNFLKLCHDEKPCTWWLGEKGLGSLQSRLARMLHHEYDALKGYRFLGGAISFYSVSCMSDVIFNPSLLNWSSLILTVAHIDTIKNAGFSLVMLIYRSVAVASKSGLIKWQQEFQTLESFPYLNRCHLQETGQYILCPNLSKPFILHWYPTSVQNKHTTQATCQKCQWYRTPSKKPTIFLKKMLGRQVFPYEMAPF